MTLGSVYARIDSVESVCCNCGKTFRNTTILLDPLCDSCKRYFQRPEMFHNPANELAVRLSIVRTTEAIRKAQ